VSAIIWLTKNHLSRSQIPNPVFTVFVARHQILAIRAEWSKAFDRRRAGGKFGLLHFFGNGDNADRVRRAHQRKAMQLRIHRDSPLSVERNAPAAYFA
jgi:hypothetical protein